MSKIEEAKQILEALGLPQKQQNERSALILYEDKRKWVFLIEAVTSHGPISPKRLLELEDMLKQCQAGKIYVTAFPDFREFRRHTSEIAWETEVWIVDFPDHMIHFNGDRFMGPR
jgi:type II restriction enzyme